MPGFDDMAPELVQMIAGDSGQAWLCARVSRRLRDILIPRSWEQISIRVDHPDFDKHYGELPFPPSSLGVTYVKRLSLIARSWRPEPLDLRSVAQLCQQLTHLKIIIWNISDFLCESHLAAFPHNVKVWVGLCAHLPPVSDLPASGESPSVDLPVNDLAGRTRRPHLGRTPRYVIYLPNTDQAMDSLVSNHRDSGAAWPGRFGASRQRFDRNRTPPKPFPSTPPSAQDSAHIAL
jgi:hypothetical protein